MDAGHIILLAILLVVAVYAVSISGYAVRVKLACNCGAAGGRLSFLQRATVGTAERLTTPRSRAWEFKDVAQFQGRYDDKAFLPEIELEGDE